MSGRQRRRIDRLSALIPRCSKCEENDEHIAAVAVRIQGHLQRALAEATPGELRRKAAELLAEAERLEQEAAGQDRLQVEPQRVESEKVETGQVIRRAVDWNELQAGLVGEESGQRQKEREDMAERVLRHLADDLDGSEAVETVRFSYAGRNYEIDLNEEHAAELDELLAPYVEHGRRVPDGTPKQRARRSEREGRSSQELRAIRQWAREQGLEVSDRGRIAADIVAQYDAAH